MNIAFVLPWEQDSGPFWDLCAPIRKTGDRVEFWFPGPVPESPPPLWSPAPDFVIYGAAADGGFSSPDYGEDWDLRCRDDQLRCLERLCTERRPGLVLFPASLSGHELAVRLAARIGCGCFPETRLLFREGERLFARKKVCGSNLDWDAEIKGPSAVVTVTVRAAKKRVESRPVPRLPFWIMDYEQSGGFSAKPLESAPLIFAAGRGLGTKAACDRLRRAAGHFGAPLGFSRPAALNGWGEIDEIIGQSGLRCAAEICVAVGVSGAAAFMAGVEFVSTLIAVNPDKDAPIFRYADIGISAGAEEFIAALEGGNG